MKAKPQQPRPQLPATELQPEIRAFPILEEVPPGHFPLFVGDDRHEPHLHADEWVVVDTTDRAVTSGELVATLSSRGPRLYQIARSNRKAEGRHAGEAIYYLRSLASASTTERFAGRPVFYCMDGPYVEQQLARDILGRVVGLLDPNERTMRQYREAVHDQVEWERAQKGRPSSKGGSAP